MKIGQKITMISVHSSGHPSRKMISWDMIRNPIGERFIPSTHRSISPCPPWSAKTEENRAEPTNSQHTMAVVLAVRNVDCFRFSRSSLDRREVHKAGDHGAHEGAADRRRHQHGRERLALGPPEAEAEDGADQAPPPDIARVLRHHRQVQGAERADRRRLGGGADAEQDHREHDDGEHPERHDRRDQLLEDLELLAVHAPVVDEEHQRGEPGQPPEPLVEVRGDPADRRHRRPDCRSHLLGRRVGAPRRLVPLDLRFGGPELLRHLLGGWRRGSGRRLRGAARRRLGRSPARRGRPVRSRPRPARCKRRRTTTWRRTRRPRAPGAPGAPARS